jgi:ADP-heptose:LPS heptosyltransferase
MASTPPKTILVYSGLELVGDGLMKLPFLRALRRAYPQAHITWLAGKGRTVYAGVLAPLVKGLIDEVIEDAGIGIEWREVLGLRPLKGRNFDLIIDTQRNFKTALIVSRIRHRVLISGAAKFLLSTIKPKDRGKKPLMVDTMLDLIATASGRPAMLDLKLELDARYRDEAARELPDRNYVGLVPGAGGKHKCWPLDRFIAVARALQAQGYVPVFFLGPDESEWHAPLADAVPGALFPLQSTTVPEDIRKSPLFTIAVAHRLALGISNDCGTGHMLAAADCPLITLWGPTDPVKATPYVTYGINICGPDYGAATMEAIPVSAVLDAAQKSLQRPFTSQSP